MRDEGALHGMQRITRSQPLDGAYRDALRLHRKHQAGTDRLALRQHRAGAAHPVLAAHMRAGQAAFLADRIEQGTARFQPQRVIPAIDAQRNFDGCAHIGAPRGGQARISAR